MQSCKTILSKAIGLLLICIFAFGITPVSYLHNVFAHHLDTQIWHNHKKSNEIAKAGMDCHTQNFVAERDFLSASAKIPAENLISFNSFSNNCIRCFYSGHHFYSELRGPPVIV